VRQFNGSKLPLSVHQSIDRPTTGQQMHSAAAHRPSLFPVLRRAPRITLATPATNRSKSHRMDCVFAAPDSKHDVPGNSPPSMRGIRSFCRGYRRSVCRKYRARSWLARERLPNVRWAPRLSRPTGGDLRRKRCYTAVVNAEAVYAIRHVDVEYRGAL